LTCMAQSMVLISMANKWQSKIDALILLAEDQAGKPEGELAKEKLRRILRRFPELATRHEPLDDFASRVFTMRDLELMRQQRISTDGAWSGGSLNEAINAMVADYKQRLWGHKTPQLNADRMKLELRVNRPLKDFAIELERVTVGLKSEYPGVHSVFELRQLCRTEGSVYCPRASWIEWQAWASIILSDGARQKLGPGIVIRASKMSTQSTLVEMECLYPAFYQAFDKLAFDLSDSETKLAFLEHELNELAPLALEQSNA